MDDLLIVSGICLGNFIFAVANFGTYIKDKPEERKSLNLFTGISNFMASIILGVIAYEIIFNIKVI